MTKIKEKDVNKKNLINSLFINTIKYVNKYSEFVADSLNLNWLKFVETIKKDRIIKINKNIEKVKKMENKETDEKYIQEIIVSNLLIINKYLKLCGYRYCKSMMIEIQKRRSLSEILEYLSEEYLECNINKKQKKDKIQEIVNSIKLKKQDDKKVSLPKSVITSIDKNNSYYVSIKIIDNKMILDEKSFELEKEYYKKSLSNNSNSPFLTDDTLKYSAFEKKRRVYIKSMYELDRNLKSLINKKVDITYPIDKVFKYAIEIVDNIYKELVYYNDKKSVLNNLMILTKESYGSSSKIVLYEKLINNLLDDISKLDKITKSELIDSAKYMVEDSGYKEFRNIKGVFPTIEELYIAANDKIILHVCHNYKSIIKNLDILNVYTEYMNVSEMVRLYNDLKSVMVQNMVSTKYFIDLQKYIINIINLRFNLDEDEIIQNVLIDDKLF